MQFERPAEVIGPDHPDFWNPELFLSQLYIRKKGSGKPIPWKFNGEQVILAAGVRKAYRMNKWIAHLKPRKIGASTFFAGVGYQLAGWQEGVHVAVIAHVRDVSADIVKSCNLFYNSTPEEIRPPRNKGLKRSFYFPDRMSSITFHSVRDDEPLRGDMGVQVLLATEISSWMQSRSENAWVSARNAVPEDGGFIVAESTPRFAGDPMDELWVEAHQPDSKWLSIFIPWVNVAEYSIEPPPGWLPNSIVREYMDKHPQVMEAQGYWMQIVGLPKCAGKLEKFMSEYPISDRECWSTTGESVFDVIALEAQARLLDGGTGLGMEEAAWTFYADPVPGHRYLLSIDPAGSWAERDQFGGVLIDIGECAVVGTFLGHCTAFQMRDDLLGRGDTQGVAYRYNKAEIFIEAIGIGEGLLLLLIEAGYDNIYYRPTSVGAGRNSTFKPGFWNDQKHKIEAISVAQELIADGSIKIPSLRLIVQLQQYKGQWDKTARDVRGGHFDLAAAFCIGCWAWKHVAYVKWEERRAKRPWWDVRDEAMDRTLRRLIFEDSPSATESEYDAASRPQGMSTTSQRTRWGVHK